jgi:hypothetical protein
MGCGSGDETKAAKLMFAGASAHPRKIHRAHPYEVLGNSGKKIKGASLIEQKPGALFNQCSFGTEAQGNGFAQEQRYFGTQEYYETRSTRRND